MIGDGLEPGCVARRDGEMTDRRPELADKDGNIADIRRAQIDPPVAPQGAAQQK